MAGFRLVVCAAFSVSLLLAVVKAQEESGCPPGNPFCPVWVPCNYTEFQGPYCHNSTTRVICTAVGGLVRPCSLFPFKSHCVDGECVALPSDELASDSSTHGSSDQA